MRRWDGQTNRATDYLDRFGQAMNRALGRLNGWRRARCREFQKILDFVAPFGGWGQSGIGRELGEEGFRSYLETRTILLP